jgi:hypothetical protein
MRNSQRESKAHWNGNRVGHHLVDGVDHCM